MRFRSAQSVIVQLLVAAVLVVGSAALFKNDGVQGVNWTLPYLSGAANFQSLTEWRISPADYDRVVKMTAAEHRVYRYQRTEDTVFNTNNAYGYVLVALAARNLFPWLGDLQAVVHLQVLVHVALSLFIFAAVLRTPLQRWLFIILYAANPIIVYVVTYPFYYFWTCIPSVALAVVWLRPEWIRTVVPLLTPVLLFSLLVRPTTVFVCLFTFAVAFWIGRSRATRAVVAGSLIAFVAGTALIAQGTGTPPYHTMYIGIGAYPNPHGIERPVDNEGYDYFEQETGIEISTHAIHGNWNNPELKELYMETLRGRYFEITRDTPLLLARNALYNFAQSFSVGYDTSRAWLRPISAALGALVIGFLVFTRQWTWLVGTIAYTAAFAWYFPPIPAYLFGAYLLTTIGVILGIVAWLGRRRRLEKV